MNPPVFLNVRDRVGPLRELVAWLERAGLDRIVLLDNASTYPPLLDYLAASPHEVVRLGANLGSRAIWRANLVPTEAFVYSDPDVVPIAECPLDVIDRLWVALQAFPRFDKSALGLYLEDVPESLPCLEWERSLVSPGRELANGVFGSLVDTTFALYNPGAEFSYEGIRLGFPCQARHISASWYPDLFSGEDAYYLERAVAGQFGSSWKESVS